MYDEIDLETILLHCRCPSAKDYKIPFDIVDTEWSRRDSPFVHRILALFADIGLRPVLDNGTLVKAVRRPHDIDIDLVKLLLSLGAVVDSRESDDDPTALHLAILHHDLSVVRTLLEAGADVHLLWMEQSVLQIALKHWGAYEGGWARVFLNAWRLHKNTLNFNCVSPEIQLLDFQDIYFQSDTEQDALEISLNNIGVDIVVDSKQKARRVLAVAAAQWYQDSALLVQMLLDAGADPTITGEEAQSPLQSAAFIGSTLLVRSLLTANADANSPPWQGWDEDGFMESPGTALQAAIATPNFNLEIVQLLLDSGADINAPAQGSSSQTALQAAIETGNFELVQLLLDRGADIDAPACSERGFTALQVAAIKGYVGLATQLIQAGADANAEGSPNEGRTALKGAAGWGRLDMVQLLLNAGAGRDATGAKSYWRALRSAKLGGHMAVHDLIQTYFDKLTSEEGTTEGCANTIGQHGSNSVWDIGNCAME